MPSAGYANGRPPPLRMVRSTATDPGRGLGQGMKHLYLAGGLS
ncbi:MAG: hypothetical protein Q6M04_03950 [Thermostichus sp. BF3_bins_97]